MVYGNSSFSVPGSLLSDGRIKTGPPIPESQAGSHLSERGPAGTKRENHKNVINVHRQGSLVPFVLLHFPFPEAEAPIVCPPDVKSWLTGKDPDAGKDWRQEEKGTTEDEMLGGITNSMDMGLSKLWESLGSQSHTAHGWAAERQQPSPLLSSESLATWQPPSSPYTAKPTHWQGISLGPGPSWFPETSTAPARQQQLFRYLLKEWKPLLKAPNHTWM